MRAWSFVIRHPRLYRFLMRHLPRLLALAGRRDASGRWAVRLPAAVAGWTRQRDLAAPARPAFRFRPFARKRRPFTLKGKAR